MLIADEMYIQKNVKYTDGRYVDAHETGNLYKGVAVFMIQGIKQSTQSSLKLLQKQLYLANGWPKNFQKAYLVLLKLASLFVA